MKFRTASPVQVFLLICFVSVVVYANSFQNSFHFDDQHYVVENPYIRDPGNIPNFFLTPRYSSFDKTFTGHYRPLVVSSYALNYAVGKLNPAGYHLVNLAFHAGSAFLVFLVLSGMFGRLFPALSAGLVFAVHPFNSEVVNYITARSSVMCAFFYLLAFWCWMRYREAGEKKTGFAARFYIASLFSFLLALLSKEAAITLPVVLGLYDLYFKNPRDGSRLGLRPFPWRASLPYLPFVLAVAVPYLLFRKIHYGVMIPLGFSADFGTNLMTQPIVLAKYLQLFLFPGGLTLDHDIRRVASVLEPMVILSVFFLLSLGIAAYLLFRKGGERRVLSFFIPWFFVTLLPTTLLPLNAVLQENRGYLAAVGFAALAGFGIGRIDNRGRRYAGLALVLLLSVYAGMTVQRNGIWKDDGTLWEDAVKKAPFSPRAHDNLGLAYFNRGVLVEAEREFAETLRLNPRYFYGYYNMGVLYQTEGRLEEAVRSYRKAVEVNPSFFRAHYNLGLAYKELGRLDDAVRSYRRAIAVDPRYSFTHNNLGVVYHRKKAYPEAVRSFQAALRIDPLYVKAHYNLGNVYLDMGDIEGAVRAYREALRIQPGFEKAALALSRAAAVKTSSQRKDSRGHPQN